MQLGCELVLAHVSARGSLQKTTKLVCIRQGFECLEGGLKHFDVQRLGQYLVRALSTKEINISRQKVASDAYDEAVAA